MIEFEKRIVRMARRRFTEKRAMYAMNAFQKLIVGSDSTTVKNNYVTGSLKHHFTIGLPV